MKNSINKVTGLQVGFTTEWVVLDNGEWRTLTAQEKVLCEAEHTIEESKQLAITLKAIKDKAVADKLALMQYDSLTTVKLWADDAVYGTEATAILNWYKAITSMSIKLENDVKAGTVPMPTEAEYKTMIEGVV